MSTSAAPPSSAPSSAPASARNVLLFFCLFLLCLHVSCPSKCDNGNTVQGCTYNRNCYGEIYCYLRNGIKNCDCCTKCSAGYNLIEVTSCTLDHNRVCKCKAGFYCTRGNDYLTHCHKPCVPCESGTFSSSPSLNSSCTLHTDCAELGKVMLRDGTATQDRTCGHIMTTPTTVATPTSSKIITALSSTTAPTPSPTNPTNPLISSLLLKDPFRTETQTQRLHAEVTSLTPNFSSETGGSLISMELLLLLVLVFLVLLMSGFCLLRKSTALKTLFKCTGFIHGKHKDPDERQSKAAHHIRSSSQILTEHNQGAESELPLSSEVRGQTAGVTSHCEGGQWVSTEHNVKGENISNTVGSIYIYSPGTVILGSSKKEEAGICEEDVPLISTPHQESSPPSEEVRIRMSKQEEEMSLSFPVPATGK